MADRNILVINQQLEESERKLETSECIARLNGTRKLLNNEAERLGIATAALQEIRDEVVAFSVDALIFSNDNASRLLAEKVGTLATRAMKKISDVGKE